MILLDTNIVIAYFQGEEAVSRWMKQCRQKGEEFCLSTVTIVELFSYSKISDEDMKQMIRWFTVLSIIDVDQAIAIQAAEIRRNEKLTTTDSMIAATAMLVGAKIATRDKAFQKLKTPIIIP